MISQLNFAPQNVSTSKQQVNAPPFANVTVYFHECQSMNGTDDFFWMPMEYAQQQTKQND